jgi:hypothetical protein
MFNLYITSVGIVLLVIGLLTRVYENKKIAKDQIKELDKKPVYELAPKKE